MTLVECHDSGTFPVNKGIGPGQFIFESRVLMAAGSHFIDDSIWRIKRDGWSPR